MAKTKTKRSQAIARDPRKGGGKVKGEEETVRGIGVEIEIETKIGTAVVGAPADRETGTETVSGGEGVEMNHDKTVRDNN
mmetsp:Transcript_31820/g.77553  ORF Transcript_31820/g.77553 Transcript_31820/m.77553 type:complete len:80 (+) Transcript_31820:835-1074(+)